MGVFLKRFSVAVGLALFLGVLAAPFGFSRADQAIRHHLGHFDSGCTIAVKVGEKFTATLERKVAENRIWKWPLLPEKIARLARPQPETISDGETIKETYWFVAVGLGAGELFAELIDPDDPTDVAARYAFKVQVVP